MAQCTPTPTATQFTTVTTDSVSTSFSSSLTTLADSVSTIVSTTCLDASQGGNGTCATESTVTSLSTIAGGVSTVQVPIPITVPVTNVQPTATLFAPCSSNGGNSQQSSSGQGQASQQSQQSSQSAAQSSPSPGQSSGSSGSTSGRSSASITGPITSALTITSTPPPTTITTSSSSTLADGEVTVVVITLTSTTGTPSAVVVNTVVPDTDSGSGHHGSSSTKHVGTIVGASIGGILGLCALLGALFLCWRIYKRRRLELEMDAILGEKSSTPRGFSPPPPVPIKHVKGRKSKHRFLDEEVQSDQPKPYQYGLVGQTHAPTLTSASPSMTTGTVSPSVTGHESVQAHSPTPFPTGPGSSAHGHEPYSPPMSRRTSSNVGRTLSPPPQDVDPVTSRTPRLSLRLANWIEETDGLGAGLGLAAADFQPHAFNAQSGSPTSSGSQGPRLFAVNAERDSEDVASPIAPAQTKAGEVAAFRSRVGPDGVIVHKDGGRVEEGSAGPLPPAYSPH
ncbi:hypothetical protein PUNSTDRAFT_144632 [Punctularia strigosozonata HHB-11173 SS5]|uniref:uncharacterized protein n=1 Tax=Punctularia strigosozonata (strain HHB-11173) TaxID=741275 RepID=UPI0004417AE6|nr:uncharacterized protein PUNSTDRAFT_144632 [Punctularia strigosozonata HHB-11173 SS5]EIN07071.1 hypothetical protein PUNSTDRAFT_144632 [Punctularia strigosozonata HHB-11173 SS5]